MLRATDAIVAGIGFALRAFGTCWIPFLMIFGIWRQAIHRSPVRYRTALWSIVFPLGMYSTANIAFGTAARLDFMIEVGRIAPVVTVLAWLADTASACHAAIRAVRAGNARGSLPSATPH
jgi:tellurite resistance protein TehA-like permease